MKRKGFVPYLVAMICTAIYISLIFNENVWMDEAFSASIIRCGFDEMITRTMADTLPPFYNVSAWLFTRIFGFSTIALKCFSVVPMTLLMIISAHFIPKFASERAASLYIIMITVMPHFLEHGVEIRMYSWAVFFAASSAIFALCSIHSVRRAEVWLIICSVLGAYTHQYALIAEAFIWLMLLVLYIKKGSAKHWIIGAGICLACYAPCAALTFFQMKAATSYFSAAPATLDSMMSSFRYPFVTNTTILSALLLLFTCLLCVYSFTKRDYTYVYCFFIYALVIALSFGLMKMTGSTFFSSRYLMPAIGMLWLGTALALDRLISENVYVWIVAVCIMTAVGITVYIQEYDQEYVDMSAFRSFINATSEVDGYVIYEDFPEVEICMGYYAPWMKSCDIDEIDSISGRKYVFFNRKVHTEDVEKIKEADYDLRYIENLSFDRYTIRAYELIGKNQ